MAKLAGLPVPILPTCMFQWNVPPARMLPFTSFVFNAARSSAGRMVTFALLVDENRAAPIWPVVVLLLITCPGVIVPVAGVLAWNWTISVPLAGIPGLPALLPTFVHVSVEDPAGASWMTELSGSVMDVLPVT